MIYPFKMVIVQFATIKNNQPLFQNHQPGFWNFHQFLPSLATNMELGTIQATFFLVVFLTPNTDSYICCISIYICIHNEIYIYIYIYI